MHLDELLLEVTNAQATDLYLIAGAVPCINKDGQFYAPVACRGQRLSPQQLDEFAHQIMTEKQWKEFLEGREANLAYMSPTVGRFRVNVLWQRGSIGMVLRRVVMDIPTLRELGLPPVLREIALADRGIVLVTGSTGSGKSTSMASMIDYRNHLRSGHIVTIEDPIEFVYQHRRSIVTQREVGMDTHSFEEALKNTLRQAPQVISIGEMRDAHTVQFAMHASETGHLVFATLHSTNATLTIERILHFFPGEMKEQVLLQLSLNLKAIICQRLVHRIGGGRACACEVMVNTPRLQDLISKGDIGAMKLALNAENHSGIQNFDKSLYRLAKMGRITPDDAMQAADSSNDLQLKFRGIGIEPGSSWQDVSDPWKDINDDFDLPANTPKGMIKDPSATGGYTNEEAPPMAPRYSLPPSPPSQVASSGRTGGQPTPAPGLAPARPAGGPFPPGGHARPAPAPAAGPGKVVDRYADLIKTAMPQSSDNVPRSQPAPAGAPPQRPGPPRPPAKPADLEDEELDIH